jgi:hypothetical protein
MINHCDRLIHSSSYEDKSTYIIVTNVSGLVRMDDYKKQKGFTVFIRVGTS